MMAEQKKIISGRIFFLCGLCIAVTMLAVILTWVAPKDDNSDAWAYHYYSGVMLLDDRLELDYFGASSQGYFNPLVHLPFAAMVKANWPDRLIATAMALYSAVALILMIVFYQGSLGLNRWALIGALILSLSGLIVWTCVGTSVPDLFLQIPIFLSLICWFNFRSGCKPNQLFMSGLFLGIALGMKLSAIIYIPGMAVLLVCGLFRRQINWLLLALYCCGGVVGFVLAYGWWGLTLYQQLGNPFFPFFNEWFKSPHYALEPIANHRFIAANFIDQFLLPFRVAGSDIFTYVELKAPDIRPGAFVLAVLALLTSLIFKKNKMRLSIKESDFLIFLVISLYAWVFTSGNGRYGVGVFLMIGAGILIALRAALPLKAFRSSFLLVLLLQLFVVFQITSVNGVPFRFGVGEWGGQWFNIDAATVLGKGNQLILTGTRNSYSVLEKDMGENTSLINVYGLYALDLNPVIEKKIFQYQGRILGVITGGEEAIQYKDWLEMMYFEQFGRFGLSVTDYSQCQTVPKFDLSGSIGAAFIFCPLVENLNAAKKYALITKDARIFFEKIEEFCPDVFSPRKYAVTINNGLIGKYYANYEIDVSVTASGKTQAKKQWSMMLFSLGNISEIDGFSAGEWHKKYCEPLRRSKATTKE